MSFVTAYDNNVEHTGQRMLLLVTELLLGGNLFSRIKSRRTFTEADAAAVVRDISSALAYLHGAGIAHR